MRASHSLLVPLQRDASRTRRGGLGLAPTLQDTANDGLCEIPWPCFTPETVLLECLPFADSGSRQPC